MFTRLYRFVVRLYPRGFQEDFGDLMADDADRLLRSTPSAGARMAMQVRLTRDLLRSLAVEWWDVVRGSPEAARGWSLGAVSTDFVAAVRRLRRRPAFTGVVVGLLGLGTAAVAIAVAVYSAYALRSLPYPEADRIAMVRPAVPLSTSEARDLFEVPLSWDLDVFTLLDTDRPELVYGSWVTPGYQDAFGLRTLHGRLFTEDELRPGGPATAVVSHALWMRRYGGDPDVVGRTVQAFTSDRPDDAESFTIVGVLTADAWHFNRFTDFLTPLHGDRPVYGGRLREGVSPEAAAQVLEARARPRMESIPDDFHVAVVPLQEQYSAALAPVLRVALLTVLLALLIACGNTAGLLLVQATTRAREFTVRHALGAGRKRIARQLLVEGGLLAIAGSLVGVGLAAAALTVLAEPIQEQLGRGIPGGPGALRLDARSLLAITGVTLMSALAFGLVPMRRALGANPATTLRDGGRGSTTGRRGRRGLRTIVAGGVALALTLVVPAALAVRSAMHLRSQDLGFDPQNVYKAGALLQTSSYPTDEARAAFYSDLTAQLESLPGVTAAAIGVQLPFHGDYQPRTAEAGPARGDEVRATPEAMIMTHDAGWFDVLGVTLERGRSFGPGDVLASEPVAIVSESLAAYLWPDSDALGGRLRIRETVSTAGEVELGPWMRVVGIAGDVRTSFDDAPQFAVHRPFAQNPGRWALLTVQTQPGAPPPLAGMADVLRAADPTVALSEEGWVLDGVMRAVRPSRFLATFLGGFSVFAIALAVLGLYAVLSFAVAQRRRDLAIRLALGAKSAHVQRSVVWEGCGSIGLGIVFGLGGAWLGVGAVADQLHGVTATDPLVFALGATGLALVATLAAWIPARRASRTHPMNVLREE